MSGLLAAVARFSLATVVTSAVLTAVPAAAPAQASGPTYDPSPTAQTWNGAVYSTVLPGGGGVFHAISRQDGLAQEIVYRRSSDGGRTWAIAGRFAGVSGGATRPMLAVDGPVVAIGFIGGYCEGTQCGEAPYLIVSQDGGQSFGSTVRLDNNARNVQVAVDGPRVWVAWERRAPGGESTVEVRGAATGGAGAVNLPAGKLSLPGYLAATPLFAAGDGAAVLGMVRESLEPTRTLTPTLEFFRGGAVAGRQSVPSLPVDVAAAEGRVHALFETGEQLRVRSADVVGTSGAVTLGSPVSVMTGTGGSLAARRGLVAVAAVDAATGVTVVSRSDDGTSFSAPDAVVVTEEDPYRTWISAAVLPDDLPIARFGWSVESRYTDRTGDGFPDPANSISAPQDVARDRLTVALDGCASVGGAGSQVASYAWSVDGTPIPATGCAASIEVANGATASVRLTVTDTNGQEDSRTLEVAPRDLLVVSIGDSVASGEGVPHDLPSPDADPRTSGWEDGPCHRSHFAGPALAARQLEEADPHTSVTFLQLSCSGASVMDVPATPGAMPSGPDDEDTGGLLDRYHGIAPDASGARPSQLDQMDALRGSRTPDAVMVSIGANDVKFSEAVITCLESACLEGDTQAKLDARLGTLPDRYAALGAALRDRNVPNASVFISEYFDASGDDLGIENLRCVANSYAAEGIGKWLAYLTNLDDYAQVAASIATGGGAFLSDDEARWARSYLTRRINDAVAAGARANGWTYVGGIEAAFARHGYCASEPWVVSLQQSLEQQRDHNGAFHPNRAGHRMYGQQLGRSLITQLVTRASLRSGARDATEVGDLYVTTESHGQVTVASAIDTGAGVQVQSSYRLDGVTDGDGMVGSAGRPAADQSSAVAAWYQLDGPGISAYRTLVAQLVVAENIAVDSAGWVQGPMMGAEQSSRRLVAGRDAVIAVKLWPTLTAAVSVDVRSRFTLRDDPGTVVHEQVDRVRVTPFTRTIVLPTADGFRPEAQGGGSYVLTVTVDDPPGATGADPADNSVRNLTESDRAFGKPGAYGERSRPMRILTVPANVGAGSLTCAQVQRMTTRWAARASAMMPVSEPIAPEVACLDTSAQEPIEATARGVSVQLTYLDLWARNAGYDSVVAVVPPRWLPNAMPGTLGIAQMGGRGAIVDASASSVVWAHEVTHNRGYDHAGEDEATEGAWVSRQEFRRGSNYQNPYDQEESWISVEVWNRLLSELSATPVPAPPDPTSGGVWVRGTVSQLDSGQWGSGTATWIPAQADAATDTRDTADLDTARMKVRQVDAQGSPLGSPQPLPLGPIEGTFAPGAPLAGPIGYFYSGLVQLDPAAARLDVLLDGEVVEQRAVSAAPTVTMSAPVGGTTVERGGALEVAWEASDPDGDTLTTDLLVSDDDGATWEPLASDVGASPVTVTVPADLGGDRVRVRVLVSDGLRMAYDDSASFTVGGAATADRLAFARYTRPPYTDEKKRLFVMDPDGSNEAAMDLPTQHTFQPGYTCDDLTPPDGYQPCEVDYSFPAWSADGTRLYFTSDLVDTRFGGSAVSGFRDRVIEHLWSVAPDGSGLTRITVPRADVATDYNTRNLCLDASSDGRIAWLGLGGSGDRRIWTANADGSDARSVLALRGASMADDPASWPARLGSGWSENPEGFFIIDSPGWDDRNGSCPQFSPDGKSIALVVSADELPYLTLPGSSYVVSTQAILVMDADGSNPRIITNRSLNFTTQADDFVTVDWLDNDTVVGMRVKYPDWYQAGNVQPTNDLTFQPVAIDVDTRARVPLAPARYVLMNWQDKPSTPALVKVSPAGDQLYGPIRVRVAPPTGGAYLDYDLATVELVDQQVATVPKDDGVAGKRDVQFDWGLVRTSGGAGLPLVEPEPLPDDPDLSAGGPYVATVDVPLDLRASGTALTADPDATVAWDLDGDGAFDDAVGESPIVSFATAGEVSIRVQVTPGSGTPLVSEPTAVTVLAAPPQTIEVDPDASGPVLPAPGPVDLAVEIPAGVPTSVRLGDEAGPPGDFIVMQYDESQVEISSGAGAAGGIDLPRTGADGTVVVTPGANVRGVVTFTYAPADDPGRTATVRVTVTGQDLPVAVDDALEVELGTPQSFPPSALLGNDSDPDGPESGLRIAALYGMTGGAAWLTPDEDAVVVVGSEVGPASFTYLVVDPDGGLATATVAVTVRAKPEAGSGSAGASGSSPGAAPGPANGSAEASDDAAGPVTPAVRPQRFPVRTRAGGAGDRMVVRLVAPCPSRTTFVVQRRVVTWTTDEDGQRLRTVTWSAVGKPVYRVRKGTVPRVKVIDLPRGVYRAVLPAQCGFDVTLSRKVRLTR